MPHTYTVVRCWLARSGWSMNTKETPRALAQRCRARASRVGFPPMREALLSIADHYELDADLLESSLQTIIDSERLIAKADQLLRQSNARQTVCSLEPSPSEHSR